MIQDNTFGQLTRRRAQTRFTRSAKRRDRNTAGFVRLRDGSRPGADIRIQLDHCYGEYRRNSFRRDRPGSSVCHLGPWRFRESCVRERQRHLGFIEPNSWIDLELHELSAIRWTPTAIKPNLHCNSFTAPFLWKATRQWF